MAVVTCPQCSSGLRVPDGSAAAVRCPKCKTVFSPPAATSDFEVVDDAPPRRRREYDDDDRRDRRRDDDEDYDRERDRPAADGAGLERTAVLLLLVSVGLYLGGIALNAGFLFLAWLGASIPGGMVVLTGILGLAGWLVALAGFGMAIAGPRRAKSLAIAATSVGGVHLILAFVAANASAVNATGESTRLYPNAVTLVSGLNRNERATDLMKELNNEMRVNPGGPRMRALQEELGELGRGSRMLSEDDGAAGSMRWSDLLTQLPQLDHLIAVPIYHPNSFNSYIWNLLAGSFELARLILLGLLLGALARSTKAHRAADRARVGWMAAAGAVVLGMLVALLAEVMLDSARKDGVRPVPMPTMQFGFGPGVNPMQRMQEHQQQMLEWQQQQADRLRALQRSYRFWTAGGELLLYLLHGGALVLPALSACGTFQAMGRRR